MALAHEVAAAIRATFTRHDLVPTRRVGESPPSGAVHYNRGYDWTQYSASWTTVQWTPQLVRLPPALSACAPFERETSQVGHHPASCLVLIRYLAAPWRELWRRCSAGIEALLHTRPALPCC